MALFLKTEALYPPVSLLFGHTLYFSVSPPGGSQLLFPAMKYELVALFCLARTISLGRNAPRSAGMPPPGASTLTAAHRVVHRVHRNAAHVGSFTSPARAPGFSVRNIFMVDVADLADGC